MKVCQITTAHPPRDVRIFHKTCASLAAAGHDVTLLVAGSGEDFTEKGVQVMMVPMAFRTRIGRILKAPRRMARVAMKLRPDVIHFHDPEFLLAARRLKQKGFIVIYDAHEDLPRQIMSKYWIPGIFRRLIAAMVERFEDKRASQMDRVIAATPFIADRFRKVNPATRDVRNYPMPEEFIFSGQPKADPPRFCYVGGIAAIRGIHEMVQAIGFCEARLDLAGPVESEHLLASLHGFEPYTRVDYHGVVGRDLVASMMSQATAGLVLFHPVPNHIDALPTKLFEYMFAGIPVIASDFPAWKEMVEQHDCGICVDPLSVPQIVAAMQWMIANPLRVAEMGNNARRLSEEQYNWNHEKVKLLAVYDSLVQ
jgi:glycosyltransferase involved in cell wall biosynthesis